MQMTKAEVLYALQGAGSTLLRQIELDRTKHDMELAGYSQAFNEVIDMMEQEAFVIDFSTTAPPAGSFVGEPELLVRSLNKVVAEVDLATDKAGVIRAISEHVNTLTELFEVKLS